MSGDQNRRTPPWLFELIQHDIIKRKFKLDAAADRRNALCKRFYDEHADGLKQPWRDPTFCNPPFLHFGDWIRKGYEEALARVGEDDKVVCLIGPCGSSQTWFHRYARAGTIYVPDQRLVFFDSQTGEPTHGADRDSMIYVLGPGFWNKRYKDGRFLVKPLAVQGLVVTKKKVAL